MPSRTSTDTLASARMEAVHRGIHFIATASLDLDCMAYLGTGLLYSLRSLALTSSDRDIRTYARQLGRYAFAYWEEESRKVVDPEDPNWVSDATRGYGAGEGLGVRRPGVKKYLQAAARYHSADVLLGFDPELGPPTDEGVTDSPATGKVGKSRRRGRMAVDGTSKYQTWCIALTSAWCGERLGVTLGSKYADVLRWLPQMRPYPDEGASQQRFRDAAYAISHVVYTLNDYGRYLLDPAWLPDEYQFLRARLPDAISLDDPDLTGEFLDSLRAFGTPDIDPLVRSGYEYLLESQNPDGSWGVWDGETLYAGFHATWAALDGLRGYRWTGPKILFPELVQTLSSWVSPGA